MNFLFTNELNALVYLPCTIYPIIYQPLSNFLWEKQYKQYVMLDFTEIIISILFLRQPNQQARQAAPFIKKKKIKTIENDESSVRFIVTRHPFHRFIKKIVWFLYFLNFQPQTFVSLQRQIGEMHTRFWLHKEKWLVKNDLF